MYHGEVNVAQEELNSFLSVAEDLQVKGLTQNKSSGQASPPHQKTEPPKPRFQKPPQNISTPNSSSINRPSKPPSYDHQQHNQDDDDVQEVTLPEIKKEPQVIQQAYIAPDPLIQQQHMDMATTNEEPHTMDMQMVTSDESYAEEAYDYGQYDEQAGGMMTGYQGQGLDNSQGSGDTSGYLSTVFSEDGIKMFSCQLCGKAFKKSQNAKTHVESVHVAGVQVNCGICAKIFKNKESLKTHFRIKHGLAKNQAY